MVFGSKKSTSTLSLQQFTDRLQDHFGKELSSVVLYGSKASGDSSSSSSGWHLLIILRTCGLELLKKGAESVRSWIDAGNPPPLFMTQRELENSADIFPIEWSDIRQSHKILFGQDLVSGIVVDRQHLRTQVEKELKGALFRLREKYLLCSASREESIRLLSESVSNFLVLFRAVLRLHENNVPQDKLEAARVLGRYISFDLEPFEIAWRLRNEKNDGKLDDVPGILEQYIKNIELVVEWVDRAVHPDSAKVPPSEKEKRI